MEEWRPVLGFEGYYEVSNTGLIRSLHNHSAWKTLKQSRDKDGYRTVHLSNGIHSKRIGVHRLVASAFVEGYFDGADVDHKDNNRENNNADNLQWITHRENVLKSILASNHVCTRDISGENNPNYGNTTLRERYARDKELAKEKQSRPRGKNGRAKRVSAIINGEVETFDSIIDCAERIILAANSDISVEWACVKISRAMRAGGSVLGYKII